MSRFLAALLILACATPTWAGADGIDEVVVVGPSWEGFTNRDGTGLYHEILGKLFALYGIKVVRQYVPSERAYDLVREGRADFMTCHDRVEPPLVLAKNAMYENQFHVFFSRVRFPDWKGQQSMLGSTVVWRIGYYDIRNFQVPFRVKEVKSGAAALGMVVLGRADFYVDDESFIRDSLSKTTLQFDMSEFRIEPVGSRQYMPVFAISERGAKVMDLYDRGMRRLYESGELQRIFAKWNQPLPHYDFAGEGE
ncbi:substrate-binding periplasmic protein [Paucidesulfovibrio longus]|uniref:substrate-binding periplasmic protein n=1 Tax=Paucidesulfovibrio longus TaxID=889 RepID=UPI0009DBAE40|nr:transporter substrate-binding domain-containing protein [Paucidesulfovibrio longus]